VSAHVRTTLACTMIWMATIAGIYLAFPKPILRLFAEGPHAAALVALGSSMLILSAAWQVFDAMQMTLAETLRAAGDTRWIAIARMILAWGVFTPAAFVVVNYAGGGPLGAMACLGGYMALLAAMLAYRFRTGAWRAIELIEPRLV
jgi:MATE family multidrug resistance protein